MRPSTMRPVMVKRKLPSLTVPSCRRMTGSANPPKPTSSTSRISSFGKLSASAVSKMLLLSSCSRRLRADINDRLYFVDKAPGFLRRFAIGGEGKDRAFGCSRLRPDGSLRNRVPDLFAKAFLEDFEIGIMFQRAFAIK